MDKKPESYKNLWQVGETVNLCGRVINDPRPPEIISKADNISLANARKKSGWFEFTVDDDRSEGIDIRIALMDKNEFVDIVAFGDALALGDGQIFNSKTEKWETTYPTLSKGQIIKVEGTFDLRDWNSEKFGLVWQPQVRILNPSQVEIVNRPPRPSRLRGRDKVNKTRAKKNKTV